MHQQCAFERATTCTDGVAAPEDMQTIHVEKCKFYQKIDILSTFGAKFIVSTCFKELTLDMKVPVVLKDVKNGLKQ